MLNFEAFNVSSEGVARKSSLKGHMFDCGLILNK